MKATVLWPRNPCFRQLRKRASNQSHVGNRSESCETHGLAKRPRVSREYVTRILRLNFLAPDIVQAILDGREPSGMSLIKLSEPLPMSWAEERARLGFTPAVRQN